MIDRIINLCKNVGIIGLQCRNYLNHSVEERNIHFPQCHGLMVKTLNFEKKSGLILESMFESLDKILNAISWNIFREEWFSENIKCDVSSNKSI